MPLRRSQGLQRLTPFKYTQMASTSKQVLITGSILIYIIDTILSFTSAFHLNHVLNIYTITLILLTPLLKIIFYTLITPIPWKSRQNNELPILNYRSLLLSSILSIILTSIIAAIGFVYTQYINKSVEFSIILRANLAYQLPAMMLFGFLIATWQKSEKEKSQAQEEAKLAQTLLLQSQLHPHVLFNSLNGIAELIHRNPPRAETSVRALADLLRRILQASEQIEFRLADEAILLQDYLELESMRLGKRLKVEWEWDEALDGIEIPPLLLQPLVENAIKHGIAPAREGGILRITIKKQASELVMSVANTGMILLAPLTGQNHRKCIGLNNLRSRLELIYGKKAQFSIFPYNEWTISEIRTPMPQQTKANDSFIRIPSQESA